MPLHLDAGAEPIPGYRLVRKLGEGGVGEAWEAIAPGGVRVALKFIRLDSALAGPELRSLDVIRDIRHPHLLDVQFTLQTEDRLVVAMPLCDKSLKDRLGECQQQGRPGLPLDELLGYMSELAGAIDFLNEPRHPSADGTLVGVQHRDIKPQNVFLVGGSARLADFGLAKVLEAGSGDHSGCMTPHYAAPELIEGRISPRSDQYSLAVTYVQLRTGQLPFRGPVSEVLLRRLHGEPDLSGLPVRGAGRRRPGPGQAPGGPLAELPRLRQGPRGGGTRPGRPGQPGRPRQAGRQSTGRSDLEPESAGDPARRHDSKDPGGERPRRGGREKRLEERDR